MNIPNYYQFKKADDGIVAHAYEHIIAHNIQCLMRQKTIFYYLTIHFGR